MEWNISFSAVPKARSSHNTMNSTGAGCQPEGDEDDESEEKAKVKPKALWVGPGETGLANDGDKQHMAVSYLDLIR